MDNIRLKRHQPVVAPEIESWDDADFVIDSDDFTFQSHSTDLSASASTIATSSTLVNTPATPPQRRESRTSIRSDFESVLGDEEKHVHLPGDDEFSTMQAIAAAQEAGVPIPKNVPPSALMGGTIRRLGGRKVKKIIQDDWDDDLEWPDSNQPLRLKTQDGSKFPDSLRQVSAGSTHHSPSKPKSEPEVMTAIAVAPDAHFPFTFKMSSGSIDLDRFRVDGDFGNGQATIKASKSRRLRGPEPYITPPTPQPHPPKRDSAASEDFELDLELPSDGKLTLSSRRDIPKTAAAPAADDADWGEGSLGIRYAGTRREGMSNWSFSPSLSSSLTAESEDESALEGLVLPDGPINFAGRLKRRETRSPEPSSLYGSEQQPQPTKHTVPTLSRTEEEDFFDGLDIGEGEFIDRAASHKHRHVQVKRTCPTSPARPKTTVALTFTSKPIAPSSRLPRPIHERNLVVPSSLEPVLECVGLSQQSADQQQRSHSRLGHSVNSSVSTTYSAASSLSSCTPRRRPGTSNPPAATLSRCNNDSVNLTAQPLRLKRSHPSIRPPPQTPSRFNPSRAHDRPASRTDNSRSQPSYLGPKTPIGRSNRSSIENTTSQYRKPFLPAGASQSRSCNVKAKPARALQNYSDNAAEFRPRSRAVSRSTTRSPSPRKHPRVETKSDPFSRGIRVRHFGDGNELDAFDDLPTSALAEAQMVRPPTAAAVTRAPLIRNRLYQNILPDRSGTADRGGGTPSPPRSCYPLVKFDTLPRFARDTAASRRARETCLAQRQSSNSSFASIPSQRVAQLSIRNSNLNPHVPQSGSLRLKKTRKAAPSKPQLISHLNPPKQPKSLRGMVYNPETFRWEGNEKDLQAFDAPASTPSPRTGSLHTVREQNSATPRPALISNFGSSKGVHVVGGMIFDPQSMCWLKAEKPPGKSRPRAHNFPIDPAELDESDDDDDDVFRDIPDLEDKQPADNSDDDTPHRMSDVKDSEWFVGEEFDVGPEFVRRQREEEARWIKKLSPWLSSQPPRRDEHTWKWAIRDLCIG